MISRPLFFFSRLGWCVLPILFASARTIRAQTPPPTDEAIRQVLRERIDERKKGVGIVVGWIDERGSRVVSYGRLRRDRPDEVDGRTVFEIGSVSKVFTALLLALAVERGEVKLDDPVSKYLPPGVRVPERNGKQITLLELATHRSGLPRLPDNLKPADLENPYAEYTQDQMYAFLSGYTLTRDPGAEYEYSNLGAGLLGHVLARHAGKSYDDLVRTEICQPLKMASTGVVLSAEAHARLASPYKEDLSPARNWSMPTLAGAGGLCSDTEDMLRFLSAQMGLTPGPLAPAMRLTQQPRGDAGAPEPGTGLGWQIEGEAAAPICWHNGGTGGYRSFIAFEPGAHRGVVVLSNSANGVDEIGFNLLRPPKVRTAIMLKPEIGDQYVGRYEIVPELVLTFSREGGRYFLQVTGQGRNEVFPETENDFFLKAVDAQVSFVRDASGKVGGLILHQHGDQTARRLP